MLQGSWKSMPPQFMTIPHRNRSEDVFASPVTLMFVCLDHSFEQHWFPRSQCKNDHPWQSLSRRRSSALYSIAEFDMDLTSIIRFCQEVLLSLMKILVTSITKTPTIMTIGCYEDIRGDFARKRSLSHIGNEFTPRRYFRLVPSYGVHNSTRSISATG